MEQRIKMTKNKRMKNAIILKIKKFKVNDEEVLENEKIKYQCPYCESGEVYRKKKSNTLYCRKCGKESKINEKGGKK